MGIHSLPSLEDYWKKTRYTITDPWLTKFPGLDSGRSVDIHTTWITPPSHYQVHLAMIVSARCAL